MRGNLRAHKSQHIAQLDTLPPHYILLLICILVMVILHTQVHTYTHTEVHI